MVLQSFELSASCGGVDYLPPHMGDFAPSTATLYTDLDTSVYSQGNLLHKNAKQTVCWLVLIFIQSKISVRACYSVYIVGITGKVKLAMATLVIKMRKSKLIKQNLSEKSRDSSKWNQRYGSQGCDHKFQVDCFHSVNTYINIRQWLHCCVQQIFAFHMSMSSDVG